MKIKLKPNATLARYPLRATGSYVLGTAGEKNMSSGGATDIQLSFFYSNLSLPLP